MSEENPQHLRESEETELEAEKNQLQEEERELPHWMRKQSDDNQEDATQVHPDCTVEQDLSIESTTDSIEAMSDVLATNTDTLPSQASNSTPIIKKRVPCKYGVRCYRVNPVHKDEFSHPGDQDFVSAEEDNDDKPECEYGTSCYRQNPQHKRDYKHTQAPILAAAPINQKKRRRKSNQEDESDNDNYYDLDDSFIDDAEDEESYEESEDEDYVPDSTEMNQELLKEEAWKATADDTPEVLELLEEAKNYLRNKKL